MTWRQGFWLGFIMFGGLAVACASASPSVEAPLNSGAASAAPTASELPAASSAPSSPAPSSSVPSATAPSSAVTGAPSAELPPPQPSLLSICRAKCDKLVHRCSTVQIDSCRVNCTKFDPAPEGCEGPVRSALECARDARDLTCANVAPESCTAKFRRIASCVAGESVQKSEAGPAIPEGWERVTDAANGYSLLMPRGATESAGPEGPVRSVTAADGTVYTVSVLPLLKEKASEKSLLHFLMKVQGRCSDKVKLDGFVEKADRSSIHFTAHCPDKTDWNGMIYINDRHLFMLSARAATGKIGITDPFFYEFEFTAH